MADKNNDILSLTQDSYQFKDDIQVQRTVLEEDEREPFIITFLINTQDDIYGFVAKGSTGFAQYGLDIIAAAVSTLAVNTVHSINRFTDDSAEVEMSKNYVKCLLSHGKVSKESKVLLNSLRLGMDSIQNSYSEKYITIEEIKIEKKDKLFGFFNR